jgi:hypothetical protein
MLTAVVSLFACIASAPQQPAPSGPSEFAPPVRMKSGDQYIRTESPGYAAPCWFDVDGDGKKDLAVGQFKKGKIKVYRGLGGGKLGEGTWLQAGGNDAEIPGVW